MKKIPFSLLLVFLGLVGCQSPSSEHDTTATKLSDSKSQDILSEGKKITSMAFTALSGKLQAAMQEGGVANAVSYCNIAALPLIDSLSKANNVSIRRTSLKYRNPIDAPTVAEVKVLNVFEDQLEKEKSLKPIVIEHNFYAPILIAPPCLKCHGKIGETLAENDYSHILKVYPEDKAIGYAPGELRGMWVVSFEK